VTTKEHPSKAQTGADRSTAEYVYGVAWTAWAIDATSGGVADAAVYARTYRDIAALTSVVDPSTLRARKKDLTRDRKSVV